MSHNTVESLFFLSTTHSFCCRLFMTVWDWAVGTQFWNWDLDGSRTQNFIGNVFFSGIFLWGFCADCRRTTSCAPFPSSYAFPCTIRALWYTLDSTYRRLKPNYSGLFWRDGTKLELTLCGSNCWCLPTVSCTPCFCQYEFGVLDLEPRLSKISAALAHSHVHPARARKVLWDQFGRCYFDHALPGRRRV